MFEGPGGPGRKAEHAFSSSCLLEIGAAPPGSDYSFANVFMVTNRSLAGETNAMLLPSSSEFLPLLRC